MRVLSIQQPWAQLVIRGVKQIEIRSWTAAYKGRIAIHASANTKWQEVEREWESSSAVARCFAEQGWIDRDDLKALPRSAILGTVELLGVHRCTTVKARKSDIFASDAVADALESAVRDRVTGHLRAAHTRVRTLPLTVPDAGYVWAFARPLEVDPILDVPGQQHLWQLPADIVAPLKERDAQNRRGEWTAPAVSRERRVQSLAAWRKVWETDLEREAMRLYGEVLRDVEIEALAFDSPQTEKWFKRTLKVYAEEHARFRKGVAVLTELMAQSEQRPAEKAAIDKEVKAVFRRLLLEGVKELERSDRWVEIADAD